MINRPGWLIPPRSVNSLGGSYRLGKSFCLWTDLSGVRLPWSRLQRQLDAWGGEWRETDDATSAHFRIREVSRYGPEAYRLCIGERGVDIESSSEIGASYAVQSLCDLMQLYKAELPCLEIDDEPALRRRGVYWDCSRGKVPTIETITRLVERLAEWRINELQLYIENVFTFASHPAIGAGFSPFTPDDIVAIQDVCRQHHIRLVPSLASLGHMEKILMLPEYQALGELPGYRDWPGGTTLCPDDPRSLRLLQDLYADFLPHFEATDFNVCGDEPWELGQGRTRERAAAVGVGRVYLDHILALHKLCERHGKRMNLWGDIVLKHPEIIADLPRDLVMLNWEYEIDGPRMLRTQEFAAAGLSFLGCPGTHGWQSHGSRLTTAFGNIYQFAGIAAEQGADGFLITDWGDWGHRNTASISLPAIAYGAACVWNRHDVVGPDPQPFVDAYCRFYYGDVGATWGPALGQLGDERYGYWAYNALFERLSEPVALGGKVAQGRCLLNDVTLSDEEVGRLLAECDDNERVLGVEPDRTDRWTVEARADFLLANQMNRASLHRYQLARRLRAGETLAAVERAAHRDELAAVQEELTRHWERSYRPSRLCENLEGFEQAMAELL